MKTNCISFLKSSFNSIIGFLCFLLVTACGSYQNSSYYDTDGIYGTTEAGMRKRAIDQEAAVAYQNYFSALQETKDTAVVFTDVASYSSYNNLENNIEESSYPGWGNNSQNININYYPDNWGLAFGFRYPNYRLGWRNLYYGGYFPYNYWHDPFMTSWGFHNYYGFNYYPNYFWGYPNYNPHYGGSYSERSYNHTNSRRGSNYNSINPSGSQIGRRDIQNASGYSNRSSYNRTNSAPTFSRNSNNFQNQNYINNTIGRARQSNSNDSNTTSVRNNSRNNNSTRSYNDNYTPTRSMDTNSSNSGGSFGGGRSSDGGGRRGG